MSPYTIAWLLLGLLVGGLETFTLFEHRTGTLSETLARAVRHARPAWWVGWSVFSVWFLVHIATGWGWLTG